MKNRISGRSAFLALLKDEGITHLFGNPGTTELPIMHALRDHPDLTYVMAMQESLVVAIADGFSRASGRLVACNVHVAPGLGNAMGAILILGRATGYVLFGCTQTVLKEVISHRDYFLTRVALRMPKPMVDLCLYDGAWEAGAKSDLIPFKDAGAGCAYLLDGHSQEPRLVRSAWISDDAIRASLDLPGDAREDLSWPD